MSFLTLEGSSRWNDTFYVTFRLDRVDDVRDPVRAGVIDRLGERYIGHQSRRVPRGQYEQKESHGADVAATFARVRERMKPTTVIIQEGK